jgi:hypothetical protein
LKDEEEIWMGFGSGGSANWGKGAGEEPRTEKVSRVKVSSDRVKREVGRDRERDRRDSQSTAE